MNRKNAKRLLLTLLAVLALGLLSACDSSDTPQGKEDSTQSQTEAVPLTYTKGLAFEICDDGSYYILTGMGICTDSHIVVPPAFNGKPVKEVGMNAFMDCADLETVILPDSVTVVAPYAFWRCTNLEAIMFPDSIMEIHAGVFNGCTKLEAITLPDSIVEISSSMFMNCTKLEKITLPKALTSIDISAFCGCTNLKTITLPDSLTSIGGHAFSSCINLENITLPNSLTSIGDYAFSLCTNLENITLPNSLTSLGTGVFDGCDKVTKTFNKVGDVYTFENWIVDIDYAVKDLVIPAGYVGLADVLIGGKGRKGHYYCNSQVQFESIEFQGNDLKHYRLPRFGEYSSNKFNKNLKKIILPQGMTEVSDIFDYCFELKEVVIPSGVTSIGEYAFFSCQSLETLVLPDGVTSIGKYAFKHCTNLKTLVIPDSVTEIGNEAIGWNGAYVYYQGTCAQLKNITFGESGWTMVYHCIDGDVKVVFDYDSGNFVGFE